MTLAYQPLRPPRNTRRMSRVFATARRMWRRLRAVGQLTSFMAGTGRWWLVPMLLILLLSAVVVAVVQLVEYAAPFVYTIF